jgi:predicted dehydrogenase
MYTQALLTDFAVHGHLVGYCDINQGRMDFYNQFYACRFGAAPVPTYCPAEFDKMIAEQRAETVIVTSIDRTHHRYIIRAMELGCDVVSEKPMTVDAAKCQAILDAQRLTGRKLTVTFNYRYAPHHTKIKEILQSGSIGKVLSVHFEWLLDTVHGADYFRRWHRDKRNSGGLMVHKATHHFDLVNWWIGAAPETVFGLGSLSFYGRANAEERGETEFYTRCHGSELAKNDPWAIHIDREEMLRGLYLNTEHLDGYIRDQSVFGDNISIEDDMALLVRYTSGATMSYHLTAYSPWEGYRVAFNGTKGRLEVLAEETSYVSGADRDLNLPDQQHARQVASARAPEIQLRPHWGEPQTIAVSVESGGHGGGDARLLADVFGAEIDDPLKRAAGPIDGALSVLTGVAANQSFNTGLPVKIADLIALQAP